MAAVGTTRLPRDTRTGRLLPRRAQPQPAEEQEIMDVIELEEESLELPERPEPDSLEMSEDAAAGPSDPDEHGEPVEGVIPERPEDAVVQQVTLRRVQAMLQEALRLGRQMGLVALQADGTLTLAGQTPRGRREDSECHCQRCTPYAQQHWWCVVCHSGPHEWQMVKPQYERQVLKPGGIEGARHAACSAQCARDYLSSLGRQPQMNSGVNPQRQLDASLGLPD